MNTQTKPSELYVAARDALRYLQSLGATDPQRSILMKPLREALKNHKPALLPDAVVELIEHCERDMSSQPTCYILVWASKVNMLATDIAQAHLPVELKPCPFCQGTELEAVSTHGVTNICCRNSECAIHHVNCSIDKWQQRGETPA